MAADTYNLTIEQGADKTLNVTVKDSAGNPVDLTGATITADIKSDYDFPTITSFDINITDAANGQFDMTLSAANSELISPNCGARYDVLLKYASGTYRRLFQGVITVSPNITVGS